MVGFAGYINAHIMSFKQSVNSTDMEAFLFMPSEIKKEKKTKETKPTLFKKKKIKIVFPRS